MIFATGAMLQESLNAMEELQKENITPTLVNIATIKPIDSDLIVKLAKEHSAVITAEDHNRYGGLGDAVGDVLLDNNIHVPFKKVAVNDQFAETGTAAQLYEKYGLSASHVAKAVKEILH